MARASRELVRALRWTADRLAAGAEYRWTHLGMCNCGHLAQTVTGLSREEIRRRALEKPGEWAEQAIEYCPGSGYPIDHVLESLFALGLTRDDVGRLEKLSGPEVLARFPAGAARALDYRRRDDVVVYLRAWADLLAESLAPELAPAPAPARRRAA